MRTFALWSILAAGLLEVAARRLGRGPTRSGVAPGRHLLVYDDACELCALAALGVQLLSIDLALVGFSEVDRHRVLDQLDRDELIASAHYVTPDGVEYHGGEAITRALRQVPGGRAAAFLDWPVMRGLRELGYRLVAWQRPRISRLIGSGWQPRAGAR